MSELHELQRQVSEAEVKIQELRKKLAEEEKNTRVRAVDSIKELIKSHGLTAAELGLSARPSGKRTAASGENRAKVKPKYHDPASGKTWTGRGRMPTWLTNVMATGRAKEDFRI